MLYMENLELAEAILKYVQEKKLVNNLDFGEEFAIRRKYQSKEVKMTVAELAAEGFLAPMANRLNAFILTEKGKKAVRIGLEKVIKDDEKELSLDNEIKRSTLWVNRITIGQVIWTVIVFLLGWLCHGGCSQG